MLYQAPEITELSTKSFLKSGDQFYSSFYRAAHAWQFGLSRKVKGTKTTTEPLRAVLDTIHEELGQLECDEGDEEGCYDAKLEALTQRKPTADEATLYLRFKCGEFKPPKKRSGKSNHEKAQLLQADPFKLALLEAIRIVKAFPGIKDEIQERIDAPKDYDAEERGWTDTSEGWQVRLDGMEQCDDPDDFCPEEEIGTWLQHLEEVELLPNLQDDTPLGEYS
tara:strand:+ start:57 stop:722 length:666 start_codon:yes stop_codon:yes gene_type:complete